MHTHNNILKLFKQELGVGKEQGFKKEAPNKTHQKYEEIIPQTKRIDAIRERLYNTILS